MTDRTRPLLIGYYKEVFFATPTEKAAIRSQMIEFAEREGYALGPIVCQEFDQTGSRFGHLIELAKLHRAAAVVIAAMADLSAAERRQLKAVAGVNVLVVPPPP